MTVVAIAILVERNGHALVVLDLASRREEMVVIHGREYAEAEESRSEAKVASSRSMARHVAVCKGCLAHMDGSVVLGFADYIAGSVAHTDTHMDHREVHLSLPLAGQVDTQSH